MEEAMDCKQILRKWRDLNTDLCKLRNNLKEPKSEDIYIMRNFRKQLKNLTDVCDSLSRVINLRESLDIQIESMKTETIGITSIQFVSGKHQTNT